MLAFAEVSDLCCTVTDVETAEKLLLRASRLIVDECGDDIDFDSARDVCAAMVERALNAFQADIFGVSSSSMSAGGYQQTFNYVNASGEVYLLDKERERLTSGANSIGFIGW